MVKLRKLSDLMLKIPAQTYLWLAILIFGASSAVTRKLTQIGAEHFIDGHNPISLCNVLFVGNLCALIVLILVYGRQWNQTTLKQLSKKDWLGITLVAILSGALAPALFFQALALTQVNNIVLVGRLQPPLTIALLIWLLKERVNRWEIMGGIAALVGVILTIILQPPTMMMMNMGGFSLGLGEILVATSTVTSAVATIITKAWLSDIPLGFFSIFRTGLGTIIFFFVALVLYGQNHFSDAFSPFLWKWMLVYGVVIVVLGQSFWLKGTRAVTVSTASLVGSFTPIISVFAAYLVLGEIPTQAQYIGGSLVLVGIFLSQVGIRLHTKRHMNMMTTEKEIETTMGFKGR